MKLSLVTFALLGAALAAEARAQQPAPAPGESRVAAQSRRAPRVHDLSRVRSIFATADVNHDSAINSSEAEAAGISRAQFAGFDADSDGKLGGDEFVVGYRGLVARAGDTAAADLETETSRIEALRKAKAAEQARLGRGPTERGTPESRPIPADATPERLRASNGASNSSGARPEGTRESRGEAAPARPDARAPAARGGAAEGARPAPAARPPAAERPEARRPSSTPPRAAPRPAPRPAPARPQPRPSTPPPSNGKRPGR